MQFTEGRFCRFGVGALLNSSVLVLTGCDRAQDPGVAEPSVEDRVSDRGAWRELSERLRPFVARRVDSASDVDDVVQEILLRMHRGLGGLRNEQRFGPWVYQVARNAIVDHQRARARVNRHEHTTDDPPANPQASEGSLITSPRQDADDERTPERMLAEVVAPFVAMLPSPCREALTLTELEGHTRKEAARMLGVSHSGMKSRVQRGRQKLRAALEDCCHIELDARKRVVGCVPSPDGCFPDERPVLPGGDTRG